MTIKQARKLLGIDAVNLSDEELQGDVDVALMFKELFFSQLVKNRKEPS